MGGSATVTVRAPDGQVVTLVPGDVIGRTRRCALCVDDGRVSEAHALVSLRGDRLHLLGLRGRFAVDSRPVADLELEADQVISLARDLDLVVLDVTLPDTLLALEGEGFGRQVLHGTSSLLPGPPLTLTPGWRNDAAAWIWRSDDGWRLRAGEGAASLALEPGARWRVAGVMLEVVSVPLSSGGAAVTRVDGSVASPLRIVTRYLSVHLHRQGGEVVTLEGAPARIVSELVALGGPAPWEVVAREVWTDPVDVMPLRARWDAALARLRGRLREAGVRTDLVRSDRLGHVELALGPQDVVVDEV